MRDAYKWDRTTAILIKKEEKGIILNYMKFFAFLFVVLCEHDQRRDCK